MKYAIGIDFGGTKIEGIIINQNAKIITKKRTDTQRTKSKKQILNNLSKVIEYLSNYSKQKKIKIQGIGIACPGIVEKNVLKLIPNIRKIEGTNLKTIFEKKFNKKTCVENDANCFALAESMFGAGKHQKNVIGVIWGTGIGCGIVLNNKIYSGTNGFAGEPGHIIVNQNSKVKCGCGKYGDFESYCSAPNLIKHYKILGGKKLVDSKYIMQEKDKIAKKVSKQAIDYMSKLCSIIIGLLNPDIIVIGGGISNSKHYKELNNLTRQIVVKTMQKSVKIVKYKLIDSSGAIGAASLVF
jgi:predicted NBD/HSP70 family sugar kinase